MTEINNEENRWWTEDSDSKITKLFDPKDISVDIRHVSIDMLLRKIEHGDIDLLPAFQRQFDLWTVEAKSQLIESISLNFPIPPLYFDASSSDKWVVVDGLQRLWTLKHFILDQRFQLKGLSALPHLNGHFFTQLERQYQRKILEYGWVVYLIRPGAPRFAIYDIFRRLNTGGVTLNAQEIRHALNPRASQFLAGLVKSKSFKKLTNQKSQRMQDFELALRFCAFYMHHFTSYQPPMSHFLDRTMEELNTAENSLLEQIANNFVRSQDFIDEVLGDQVFKKKSSNLSKARFNKTLYEIWTVLLAWMDDINLEKIRNEKKLVINHFNALIDTPDFHESISVTTASRRSVLTRFTLLENMLRNTKIC